MRYKRVLDIYNYTQSLFVLEFILKRLNLHLGANYFICLLGNPFIFVFYAPQKGEANNCCFVRLSVTTFFRKKT